MTVCSSTVFDPTLLTCEAQKPSKSLVVSIRVRDKTSVRTPHPRSTKGTNERTKNQGEARGKHNETCGQSHDLLTVDLRY